MKRRAIAIGAAAIAGFVLVLLVGALVVISTGTYNVAATAPHTAVARWLLNTTQERSVSARADDVPAQPPVDSAMLRHGFEEYREMCVACHGAPGVERGALGKGINPEPPDLAKESAEWSDGEIFWITKHGIKMAGMPAFGVTHSDEELWGIVAFVRRLESMSPEEYRRLAGVAETHAHAGMVETEPQAQPGVQETDQAGMDHSRTAGPIRRAGAQAPSRGEMTGMHHDRRTADRPAAERAEVDADATEKLKTLATELLRDSVVVARIRADSALQRRLDNTSVPRQPARPPQ
jgi:mono/diheme cytochrome c family protein